MRIAAGPPRRNLPCAQSAAYQEHFIDLCRLLGQPTPVEADPSGNDFFCFQNCVVKGAEFLNLEHPDCGDPTERGFADVWRKDCRGWEYKSHRRSQREQRASLSLRPSVTIRGNQASAVLLPKAGTQNTEFAPQVVQPQKLKRTTWELRRACTGVAPSMPATHRRAQS